MVKKSGESGESGEIEKWRNLLSKVEKFINMISTIVHTQYILVARTALLAAAGAAGEQTPDHGGGESGKADPLQLNPPASRQCQHPGAQALTRVLPSSSE